MPKLPQISGFYFLRQIGSHMHMRRDTPFAQIAIPNHKAIKRGTLQSIIR